MENLYRKMCEFGLTQQQLADKLHASRGRMMSLINVSGCYVRPNEEKILSELFNCNVYDLYSLDELLRWHKPKTKEEAELLINKIKEEYDNI